MGAVNHASVSGARNDKERLQALKLAAQRAPALFSGDYADALQADNLAHPPPPGPDLTDAAVRAAAIQGMGAIGQGRKSTFLSGGSGFGAPTTKRKSLLGGM